MDNKWDKVFSEGKDFSVLNLIFLDRLLKRIEQLKKDKNLNNPLKTLVDLGSGTGDAVLKFAERGFNVQGIDHSQVAIKKAQELIDQEGFSNKVKFTEMDLDEFNKNQIIFKPADVIFTKLTLAFIKDRDRFLKSVKTVLSDSSIFVIITPITHPDINYEVEDKPGIAVGWGEIAKLIKDNFGYHEIFHRNYFGNKGEEITFIALK